MNRRNLTINFITLGILLIVTLTFFSVESYSYFDMLTLNHQTSISIGFWEQSNSTNSEIVSDYIDGKYPTKSDYIKDIIGSENNQGDYVIDPLYEDYTIQELIEMVDLIDDFTERYLTTDSKGNYVFPAAVEALTEELTTNFKELMPGESRELKRIIQTAELAGTFYWSPVMLQIDIVSPNGEDLSDYIIELFVDGNAFRPNDPFVYNYMLEDKRMYNARKFTSSHHIQVSSLTEVTEEINLLREIYELVDGQYNKVNFLHTYNKPSSSGSWSRFPQGPKYTYGLPTPIINGTGRTFTGDANETVEGLVLNANPDGVKVSMRLDIVNKYPRSGDNLPLIPISLMMSRGLRSDAYGNILDKQSNVDITPIVTFKVVKGTVWDNADLE